MFSKYDIFQTDVLRQGIPLPDKHVHCCITSPPFWGLRDYQVEGQIGNEKCHDCEGRECGECFVCHIVGVFRHVKRVLRDDGTAWLNLGDSFGGLRGGTKPAPQTKWPKPEADTPSQAKAGTTRKQLMLIPSRVAMGLQKDGWFCRTAIPWVKRSAMPSSQTDRPTVATETFFLLAKSERYFYDAERVKIAAKYGARGSMFTDGKSVRRGVSQKDRDDHSSRGRRDTDWWFESLAELVERDESVGFITDPDGQPLGLDFVNSGFTGQHFACFPPKMVAPCLKASTSEKGCCPKCGAPYTRIVERNRIPTRTGEDSKVEWSGDGVVANQGVGNRDPLRHITETHTKGWEAGCECNAGTPVACRVLDCFSGAASTGIACLDLDLDYYGCELNGKYIEMSKHRLEDHKRYLATGVKPVQPKKVDKDDEDGTPCLFGGTEAA